MTKRGFGLQETAFANGDVHTFYKTKGIMKSHLQLWDSACMDTLPGSQQTTNLIGSITFLTRNPKISVVIKAPKNPSQVFFGDNFIKGVLPNEQPNT